MPWGFDKDTVWDDDRNVGPWTGASEKDTEWDDDKDLGAWAFTKQEDKLGYVNNPRFTTSPDQEDEHHPCGYWLLDKDKVNCIDFVAELELTYGTIQDQYKSNDGMIMIDGMLYGGDYDSGTIFRIDPDAMVVERATTFADADVTKFVQLQYSSTTGYIYALIHRSATTHNWIQKIALPTGSQDGFTLVGYPLWAGSVVWGTDGNIYGSYKSANMNNFWDEHMTPITGSNWSQAWELLPAEYSGYGYTIDANTAVYNGRAGQMSNGANLINFRIYEDSNGINYVCNNGPYSGFLGSSSGTHSIQEDGTWNMSLEYGNTIGPNELVVNPDVPWELANSRHQSATGTFRLDTYNVRDNQYIEYATSGLLDPDGVADDHTLWHHKTVWHTNGRIYDMQTTYLNDYTRIVAFNFFGEVLYQYATDISGAGSGGSSFVIHGDYIYMWIDGVSDHNSTSFITKLTLDLEYVCEMPCSGQVVSGPSYEEGRFIISDGDRFIYNWAENTQAGGGSLLTKYAAFDNRLRSPPDVFTI